MFAEAPRLFELCDPHLDELLFWKTSEVSFAGRQRNSAVSSVRLRLSRTGPVMMVRALVLLLLLLGLVASCRAEFAPPTLNISLDEDPEVRWMPLIKAFDVDYLKQAAAEVIE